MALTTYEQIEQEVKDAKEELLDHAYPDDLLREWADAEVPVYTHEIISEWQELESDYRDQWQELGEESGKGISDLMQIDLYLYYCHAYELAWSNVQAEIEAATELI